MTTAAPTGAGAPPAAPVTPAPDVAPPPAAPPPAGDGAEVRLSSRQLQERLSESSASGRKALLGEFGFKSQDEMKAAIARLKTLEDEKLTSEQRTQKALEEATAKAQAGEAHSITAKAAVELAYATLSAEQKAAVDAVAPADTASTADRLRFIQFARALPGAPASGTQQPPGAPPPVTTTPPTGAPRPTGAKTAYERWAEFKDGSLSQSAFYRANAAEIEASRPPPR